MSDGRTCRDCGWARATSSFRQWCECPVPKIGWNASNKPPDNRIDLDNPFVGYPCWVLGGVHEEAKPKEPSDA